MHHNKIRSQRRTRYENQIRRNSFFSISASFRILITFYSPAIFHRNIIKSTIFNNLIFSALSFLIITVNGFYHKEFTAPSRGIFNLNAKHTSRIIIYYHRWQKQSKFNWVQYQKSRSNQCRQISGKEEQIKI